MATFQIEWKPSAIRELKWIDRQVIPRIVAAVESLASEPHPSGASKLRGGEHTFRIRVGDYRVIYEVFDSTSEVQIVCVRQRRDVYSPATHIIGAHDARS